MAGLDQGGMKRSVTASQAGAQDLDRPARHACVGEHADRIAADEQVIGMGKDAEVGVPLRSWEDLSKAATKFGRRAARSGGPDSGLEPTQSLQRDRSGPDQQSNQRSTHPVRRRPPGFRRSGKSRMVSPAECAQSRMDIRAGQAIVQRWYHEVEMRTPDARVLQHDGERACSAPQKRQRHGRATSAGDCNAGTRRQRGRIGQHPRRHRPSPGRQGDPGGPYLQSAEFDLPADGFRQRQCLILMPREPVRQNPDPAHFHPACYEVTHAIRTRQRVSLEAIDLGCIRGERRLFRGLHFRVGAGEALIVEGPNGTGKSSLLRILAGFLEPAEGSLHWDGTAVEAAPEAHRARVAWAGHLDALKAAFTVQENLAFSIAALGEAAAPARLAEALSTVRLGHIADLPARYLSAGQRRRLALARLLACDRPLWLLDEPTSALDTDGAAMFARLLATHLAGGGLAVIASHLDLGLAGILRLRLG